MGVGHYHLKNTDEPITVTLTFVDLSEKAQEDLSHYYRHNKLVVSAKASFDPDLGRAKVVQHGMRYVMKDFAEYFKADKDGKKVGILKQIYSRLKEKYSDLAVASTKGAMEEALREYEEGHIAECELIESTDIFYGSDNSKLSPYIQWIYVPAVKDAAEERMGDRNTYLGKLIDRTIRAKVDFEEPLKELREKTKEAYKKIIEKNQRILEETSDNLKKRLAEWSHPKASLKLEWWQDPDKSVNLKEPSAQVLVGEDGFEGELYRLGHGLQRSYLIAILQELSSSGEMPDQRLIFACEEPEIYQHPSQARHLSNILQNLSTDSTQVIVCTHSPYFVSGKGFEDIRLIRKEASQSKVSQVGYAKIEKLITDAKGEKPKKPNARLAKLHQSLQPSLNEMFFTPKLVFVEGLEDVAYITTYMHLMGLWEEYRQHGCHMIPANGKSCIIEPFAIAQLLGIPTYVVFDSDSQHPKVTTDDGSGDKQVHEKENLAILKLSGISTPEAFPDETLWGDKVTSA